MSCDDCCPSFDGVIAFNALEFFRFNFRLPPARPSSRSEQSPDVKIISRGKWGGCQTYIITWTIWWSRGGKQAWGGRKGEQQQKKKNQGSDRRSRSNGTETEGWNRGERCRQEWEAVRRMERWRGGGGEDDKKYEQMKVLQRSLDRRRGGVGASNTRLCWTY